VEAGVTRYFDNDWHISGGYVYLENTVPEKFFTPLVPDQDLHVFSAGVGGVSGKEKKLSWDLTYQFTFGTGRDVAGSVYGPAVTGHYTFIAHAFSLSLGYRF
jgi:long-subunit fatty acid transport protein